MVDDESWMQTLVAAAINGVLGGLAGGMFMTHGPIALLFALIFMAAAIVLSIGTLVGNIPLPRKVAYFLVMVVVAALARTVFGIVTSSV